MPGGQVLEQVPREPLDPAPPMEIREHDGHLGSAHADVTSPFLSRVDTRFGGDGREIGSVVTGRFVRRTTTQA